MKKGYIYARVSSTGAVEGRQNCDRQIMDLTEYAKKNDIEIIKIHEEHISGAKANNERNVLHQCLVSAKENGIDLILFSELSRLGRSVLQVQESIKYMVDNQINAYFLKEGLHLMQDGKYSPYTNVLISCLGMVAEIERENIAYRLNSGRKLAIDKGVKMGRKEGSTMSENAKLEKYSAVIKKLRAGEKMTDIAAWCKGKEIKCSIATIKRLKKEFC